MNTVPQASQRAVPESLRALLENLIDYAGLFPPAALDMSTAVRNYAEYLDGEHSWMLGRFVAPVGRLSEFEQTQASVRSADGSPVVRASSPAFGEWKLTALLGSNAASDIEHIAEFNLRNSGRARIGSIEVKITDAKEIRSVAALLPSETSCYFEISSDRAPELLPVVREVGARAKIRTGGITPDAIPTAEVVAGFIAECARSGVAFKATAGLHHPLRCTRPLTYAVDAPRATMHGFLNVLFAAAVAYRHNGVMAERRALPKLAWTSPQFEFTDQSAVILNTSYGTQASGHFLPAAPSIPTAFIRSFRSEFFISFGSCSFEEPISDLHELRLL